MVSEKENNPRYGIGEQDFYLLMDLIGLDTETEVHTSDGSIDMKVEREDYIYIIELKYDHTAEEAL